MVWPLNSDPFQPIRTGNFCNSDLGGGSKYHYLITISLIRLRCCLFKHFVQIDYKWSETLKQSVMGGETCFSAISGLIMCF